MTVRRRPSRRTRSTSSISGERAIAADRRRRGASGSAGPGRRRAGATPRSAVPPAARAGAAATPIVVEREAEGGRRQRLLLPVDALHEDAGLTLPTGHQHRVGVQEQQPGKARPCRRRQRVAGPSAAAARAPGWRRPGRRSRSSGRWSRRRPRSPRARGRRPPPAPAPSGSAPGRLRVQGGNDHGDHGRPAAASECGAL